MLATVVHCTNSNLVLGERRKPLPIPAPADERHFILHRECPPLAVTGADVFALYHTRLASRLRLQLSDSFRPGRDRRVPGASAPQAALVCLSAFDHRSDARGAWLYHAEGIRRHSSACQYATAFQGDVLQHRTRERLQCWANCGFRHRLECRCREHPGGCSASPLHRTPVQHIHIGCGEEIKQCDTLVLSKRPFIEKKVSSLGKLWQNRLTYSAIDFDGTKISFLVAHLAKPYFDDFQADELVDLGSATDAIDAPLVLTGDFNSAILDPRIQRFMRTTGFHTVFPEPATWPIKARDFGISIDHVLARVPLRLKSVERIEDNMGSNHFGLMAEFALDS
ncbi:endonuclease/exonuclease/phosphatase family protein [Rhizobium sp. 3T7]|nr:endonuclease/exonuclease/phosphatase family protein [Rhizobium sp. 3T7]